MRRRAFISHTLTAAGLLIPAGVLDSAARLEPTEASGHVAAMVDDLEASVHRHAMAFPTTPAADAMPALVRDFTMARRVVTEAPAHLHGRVYGSVAYLRAFLAAQLADQQDYDGAHRWYGVALSHAEEAGDHEATGWIAGRAALMPWYRHDAYQTMHDAAFAAVHSPVGQLGTTLGNALAASTLARIWDRRNALRALDASERATERSEERFTAYSFPSYRWHKFASDVRTHLGDVARARHHQTEALAGYPKGAITDPTFVRLDEADCMTREGYGREAAEHAVRTVLTLTPERALPALLDRAEGIADSIGTEADHLRHVIAQTRVVAA